MYTIENDVLLPLFRQVNGIFEPYNQCRQILPDTYLHNGYIDIFNASVVKGKSVSGEKMYPYVMDKEE